MDILSILPNLGIGVVAVLSLVYVAKEFIAAQRASQDEHRKQITQMHSDHMKELRERELAIRDVEREVRTEVNEQLSRSSTIMERAVRVLDKKG